MGGKSERRRHGDPCGYPGRPTAQARGANNIMYLSKDDIRPGLFITKDGGPCIDAPRPRPVRYGDPPPYSEASRRLDEIRARLEKLRVDLRAARK